MHMHMRMHRPESSNQSEPVVDIHTPTSERASVVTDQTRGMAGNVCDNLPCICPTRNNNLPCICPTRNNNYSVGADHMSYYYTVVSHINSVKYSKCC